MTAPRDARPLPARGEINVHDSLDERCACDHFLGKDLIQAETLFRNNFMYYQEDLMFMGPRAFRYYVQAAINYLRSDHAAGDSDAARTFASVVAYWLEYEQDELRPVAAELAASCKYLGESVSRFACDPSLDGDVGARYRALHQSLGKLASAPS